MNPQRFHFLDILCEDGSRALIRPDAIDTVLVRKNKSGHMRVVIPLKAKTLETQHTYDDFWSALQAAQGGLQTITQKVAVASFPEPVAEIAPPRKKTA